MPALVQDADIYLLDDVLSAVDATVGRWLLQHAICGPLLADKTRILCSHSRSVFRHILFDQTFLHLQGCIEGCTKITLVKSCILPPGPSEGFFFY